MIEGLGKGYNVIILDENDCVTKDYRTDRVRIFESGGVVTKVPKIG